MTLTCVSPVLASETQSADSSAESAADTVSQNKVPSKGPHPFTDVSSGKYYSDAVQWAYENDIVNGKSATKFGPSDTITRAQIAVILYNALGKDAEVTGTNPFADVSSDKYYYSAVLWANEEGIAAGTKADTFAPYAKTTRAQAIAMLWRAYGKESHTTKNPFLDVPSGSYYYDPVLWAYENSYTNGISDYIFGSDNNLNRGQFVTWLYNISQGNNEKRVVSENVVGTLTTVYNGVDYARVFDYEYYLRRYPNVRSKFKKNPEKALEYFVVNGMGARQRASRNFDVKSYYRANRDLRELYGLDYPKYYHHYVTRGYKENRRTTEVPEITEPITTYKGTDLSSIYDYNYYRTHQAVIQQEFGDNEDDAGAIARFVTVGLVNGTQAKEGVTSSSEAYRKIKEKFHPTPADAHLAKANEYSSSTGWLALVDKSEHRVYIYEGARGSWKLNRSFLCANGAAATPTPSGVYSVYGRKYYFDSGSVRCFYATMFYGAYYFHSTLYAQTSKPTTVVDDRVGMALSHGCCRLRLENAKWVYDNIPTGTTVVVY